MDIESVFEKYTDEEFLKFERIKNKLSSRPDLHAFMLLDSLIPGYRDMVGAAEHDETFLSIEPDELAEVATDEQIIDLIRCGVRYDHDDGLCMFV